MDSIIPKLRKKIASFVKDEKGSVSKQDILALGTIVAAATTAAVINSEDAEAGNVVVSTTDHGTWGSSSVSHAHHANHGSHSSHSSHSSGCAGCGAGCGGGGGGDY